MSHPHFTARTDVDHLHDSYETSTLLSDIPFIPHLPEEYHIKQTKPVISLFILIQARLVVKCNIFINRFVIQHSTLWTSGYRMLYITVVIIIRIQIVLMTIVIAHLYLYAHNSCDLFYSVLICDIDQKATIQTLVILYLDKIIINSCLSLGTTLFYY